MKTRSIKPTIALLYALSASFNAFWVFTIIKAASKTFKKAITLYDPVGPLSGLFAYSLLVAAVVFVVLLVLLPSKISLRQQKIAYGIYFISIILFFLMVFPPIFEPIAELFK